MHDCAMLLAPMVLHGWMALTSYRGLSAADQKPESTVPDDEKKAETTQQLGTPAAAGGEQPDAEQTTTVTYDPYQAYANYYGGYTPGYGYSYGYPQYPAYGYGYTYGNQIS